MKKVVCFWILGKSIDIFLCVLMLLTETFTNDSIAKYLSGKKIEGFALFLIYVLELWFTEVWTGKFVFENKFLEIFSPPEATPSDTLDSIRSSVNGAIDERLVDDEKDKSRGSLRNFKVTNLEQLSLPVVRVSYARTQTSPGKMDSALFI